MTLYEMTGAAAELYLMLESGEIDEQIYADTLESIGADEKVESYCKLIKQVSADSEMCKAEAARLTERKRVLDNTVKDLKERLKDFVQASGKKSVSVGVFTASLRNSKAVKVVNEELVPECYKVPQPAKISLVDIGDALKAGEVVPGAEFETRTSLTVR